jgi:hypothetical protein
MRGRRDLRVVVLYLAVLALAVPASASGYGTVIPNNPTTDYPFGWSAARQQTFGGPEPVVAQYDYDWFPGKSPLGDTCDALDKIDNPVRAFTFRNADDGQRRVHISFPRGGENRRLIGRDLRDARKENSPTVSAAGGFNAEERRDCAEGVLFDGMQPSQDWGDWQKFDDSEWLNGPYYVPNGNPPSFNGGDVYAAMHEELRANIAKDTCSVNGTPTEARCWFASITSARSVTTGVGCQLSGTPNVLGACFDHHGVPPNHLIATLPYEYHKDWDCAPPPAPCSGRHGYIQHSNILKGVGDETGYYMLAVVSAPGFTGPQSDQPTHQEGGLCLLHTTDVSQPTSWHAWDGDDFGARPTTDASAPDDNICKPVTDGLDPWSLTYNTYLKKYMVLSTGKIDGVGGVYYRLSDDLRTWSEPQLVMRAQTRNNALDDPVDGCKWDAVTYPVVLDPNDPANPTSPTSPWPAESPNFERPGARPDLYFHHLDIARTDPENPSAGCTVPESGTTWKASNIARLPIDFRPQRQATLQQGFEHPETGYDTNIGLTESCAGSYDPEGGCAGVFALPNYWVTAHGRVNTKWTTTPSSTVPASDVWYGSAFRLPDNLFDVKGGWLMRWFGQNNSTGGLAVDGLNDSLSVVLDRTGPVPNPTTLATIKDDPATPADEVPTVGAPGTDDWVWIEVHQRFGSSSTTASTELYINGKLVDASTTPNAHSDTGTISEVAFGFTDMSVNAGYLALSMGMDRSTILGGERGDLRALATPVGLRNLAFGPNLLTWNPVTGADDYRIYKLESNGWQSLTLTGGASLWVESTCSGEEFYRVTSVHNGYESVLSSPARLFC